MLYIQMVVHMLCNNIFQFRILSIGRSRRKPVVGDNQALCIQLFTANCCSVISTFPDYIVGYKNCHEKPCLENTSQLVLV